MDSQRLGLAGLLAVLTGAPLAIALSSGVFGVRVAAYVVTGLVWIAAFVVAWPSARDTAINPLRERIRRRLTESEMRREYGVPPKYTWESEGGALGWACPYCSTSNTRGELECKECGAVLNEQYRRVKQWPKSSSD